jgi:tripeptide aminopeptidase
MTPREQLVQTTIRSGAASLCAADDETLVYCETGRGINPLLAAVERERSSAHKPLDWGDKLVGRAAGLLLVLTTPRSVFAGTISSGAAEVLHAAGIPFTYDVLIPDVLNREGTGPCPMEAAVRDVVDPAEAFRTLERTVQAMSHTRRLDTPEKRIV